MRVLLSWLGEFARFGASASDQGSLVALGRVMDDLGMVVEGIEVVPAGMDGVVVCRVVEIAAIAGADLIRRVVVDAGPLGVLEVVCGATNFAVGDLVPLATVGTVLPGGMAVGRRRMRGVESHGMLCSGAELGLSAGSEGLYVLGGPAVGGAPGGPAARPGTALAEALGIEDEVVFDLAIETNRPDAMCVAGVARDLAARLGLDFAIPNPSHDLEGDASVGDVSMAEASVSEVASLRVEADDLCPRFVARVLSSVTVTDSPPWIRRRLALAGMRPINSVVDASNYVMLELGQPTHPYDLDRLGGQGIVVRRGAPGETLITLDGVERLLSAEDCLICDAKGTPVGIAGIMGGSSSEIGPETRRVLLEAAWFDPMAIARTSRRLGLRSEASARFERGCDWAGIERAVARFCELVAGPGAEVVVPGSLSHTGAVPVPARVRLRTSRVNAILGTELSDDQVQRYLGPIGFSLRAPSEPGVREVLVPTWRPDCTREIDLIEEVGRHLGYSSIRRTRHLSPRVGGLSAYQRERRLIRATLVGLGADEAWTSAMVPPEDHSCIGSGGPVIELEDPLAREESTLRASLLPGLLRAVAFNSAHQEAALRLFEVGRVFGWPAQGAELPAEREMLGVVLAMEADDAAAAVRAWRALAAALRLAPVEMVAASPPGMHPTRTARLVAPDGLELGEVGEVHPALLELAGLRGRRIGWLGLDLGLLHAVPRRSLEGRPISRFPSAEIDLAFVVGEAVPAAEVEATIASAAGDKLAGIALFDVYRSAQLGAGQRSLAYRVNFAALDHTLTEVELTELRQACVGAVESAHGARLR